ncbi:hypothetical protein [Streptomyces sp. NPDC049040]|uniref:hypothetical protein n=1 Tax=Streptomyces sp. NPDC049040 TaxID=3365593 RepID=UPI003713DEE7
MGAGRRVVAGAVCALAAAVLSGCGPGDAGRVAVGRTSASSPAADPTRTAATPAPKPKPKPTPTEDELAGELSFTYHGTRPEKETINQTVDIKNDDERSLVPTLVYTALDSHRRVLPHVKVRTVYGSDRGTLAVPYGYGLDILRFSGQGEHDVADVRVTVRGVRLAPHRAGTQEITVQPISASGAKVDKFSRFTALRLTNHDAFDVYVRIAYLVYDQPSKGHSQQAVAVTPIGGLVRVPADGLALVKVTGAAAAAVARYSHGPAVSVKPYPSL